MLDHDALTATRTSPALFGGEPVGNLTRDEVLDNITLTWVTNTGVSSGRLYWENTLGFFDAKGVTVPAAVSVFPRELYQAPRSWAEQAYPNLIYFNEVDEGNHFAAWQEPELFTSEVRAAFRSLRTNGGSHEQHVETATEIRPFHVEIPEEQIDDLRRRIAATRWPSKELVADRSQGVQLATIQALARYWANDYDFGRLEARLNALPQFTTEIDGVDIHFIHVKSRHENALPLIMTHGWPGSVDRAARDRRPAHRPDRARRHRRGRVRPRAAVPARLRLLRRADRARLGRRPHRTRVGGADGPPRLHALRRPGRRRGRLRHRRDGPPSARGAARHPPQRAHRGGRSRGPTAGGVRAGTGGARRAHHVLDGWLRHRPGAVHPAADDRLLPAGFTRRPGGLDARPRHGQLLQDLPRVRRRRARGQSHPGQHRRRHHAVLADGHRRLGRPVVLGVRTGPGRSRCGRPGSAAGRGSGRLHELPRRGLPCPAQLGRGGLPQPRLLQRGRQGRPLRRLGGAGALLRRGAGRIQVTANERRLA